MNSALQGQVFQVNVIDKLHELFVVKSEEVAEFKCIVLNIKKNGVKIELEQDIYVKKLKYNGMKYNRNSQNRNSAKGVKEI